MSQGLTEAFLNASDDDIKLQSALAMCAAQGGVEFGALGQAWVFVCARACRDASAPSQQLAGAAFAHAMGALGRRWELLRSSPAAEQDAGKTAKIMRCAPLCGCPSPVPALCAAPTRCC